MTGYGGGGIPPRPLPANNNGELKAETEGRNGRKKGRGGRRLEERVGGGREGGKERRGRLFRPSTDLKLFASGAVGSVAGIIYRL